MSTTPRYRCLAARTATLLAACALAGPALADDKHDKDKHDHGRPTCSDLTGRRIADAQIVSADLVAATETLPEYCRVHGLIEPKLNFELRLPSDWNSKLHYGGGGGYNGSIPPVDTGALQKGFAQVSSDSGHQGSGLDASFMQNDPLAAAQFGFLSVPTVTHAAREIVRVYYRHLPRQAYFEGCSNGGREALMTVQRFPWLFDGVIARAPAYNRVGIMGAFNRTAKALAAPGGAMSAAKVTTLSNAVLGRLRRAGRRRRRPGRPTRRRARFDAADAALPGRRRHRRLVPVGRAARGGAIVDRRRRPSSTARYRNAGWPLSGNENAQRRLGHVGQQRPAVAVPVPGHDGQVLPGPRSECQLAAVRL